MILKKTTLFKIKFTLLTALIVFNFKGFSQVLLPAPPLLEGPTFDCDSATNISRPLYVFREGKWFNRMGIEISAPLFFQHDATILIADNFIGNIKTNGEAFTGIIRFDEGITFTGELPDTFQSGGVYIAPAAVVTVQNKINSDRSLLIRVCETGTLHYTNGLVLNPEDRYFNKGNIVIDKGLIINERASFVNLKGANLTVNDSDDVVIVGTLSNFGTIHIAEALVQVNPGTDVFQNFCSISIGGSLYIKRDIDNQGIFMVNDRIEIFSHTFFNTGTLTTGNILIDGADRSSISNYTGFGENAYLIVENNARLINSGIASGGFIHKVKNPSEGFEVCSSCAENNLDKLTSFTIPDYSNLCKAIYNPYGIVKIVAFIDDNNNAIFDDGESLQENIKLTIEDSASETIEVVTNNDPSSLLASRAGNTRFSIDISSLPLGLFVSGNPLFGATFEINIAPDTSTNTIEIPLVKTPTITGQVFEDENENGIFDNTETGVENISIIIKDSSNTTTEEITNIDGHWIAGSITPGTVEIAIDPSMLLANNYRLISDNPLSVNLSSNPISDINFALKKINPRNAGGVVYNDLNGNGTLDIGESGIPGVGIRVVDGLGNVLPEVFTNANGIWNIPDVLTGTIEVRVNANSTTLASFTATSPSSINETLTSSGITNLNFGFERIVNTSTVGGVVYEDLNANGSFDVGESGIPNVGIRAIDGLGNPLAEIVTDANGIWNIPNIAIGAIQIQVNNSTLNAFVATSPNPINETLTSSGITNLNFGFERITNTSTVGGVVYEDLNANGSFDIGESGIPGAGIRVTDGLGNPLTEVFTNANGIWSIPNVTIGAIQIRVNNTSSTLNNFVATSPNPINETLTLSGITNLNFGFNRVTNPTTTNNTSLSGIIYNDINRNSTKDSNENGLNNIALSVFVNNDLQEVVTNENGNWTLNNINASDRITIILNLSLFPANSRLTAGALQTSFIANENSEIIEHGVFTPPPIRISQVITPNGDGRNDFLQILGIRSYPVNEVVILDVRTGREVYRTNNYTNDGNIFNGRGNSRRILVSGTYFLILNYLDENQLIRSIEKPIYLRRR